MIQTVILYNHKIVGPSLVYTTPRWHSPKAHTFTCHHSTISVKKKKKKEWVTQMLFFFPGQELAFGNWVYLILGKYY